MNIYGVFALTNRIDAGDKGEYEQAVNMIEAAKTAGVKHVVLSLFPDIAIFKNEQCDISSNSM